MSHFDEQPDGDIHGECAMEIQALQAQLAERDKLLEQCEATIADLKRQVLEQQLLNSRFLPDWANYRVGYKTGVDEAIHEVSQLCIDYSAMNGSVYIKDVLSALESLKELLTTSVKGKDNLSALESNDREVRIKCLEDAADKLGET